MPNDRDQGVVDVAEFALATGSAVVDGGAGAVLGTASAIVGKLATALEHRRARRLGRFLELVSSYLDAGDPVGAAAFVQDAVATEEFADALVRGYERMRRSYDPLAEECICLLTAEHLRSGEPTARRYVAVGALLEACDASLLLAVRDVSIAYQQAAGGKEPDERVLFDLRGYTNRRAESFVIVSYVDGSEIGRSQVAPMRATFRRALTLLDQQGFGSTWQGLAMDPPQDLGEISSLNSRHQFPSSAREPMQLLECCLAPVRRHPEVG